MKKYIYIAIALFTCALGFTACGSDSDDSGYAIVADKGAAVAGTYSGTWTYTDADGVATEAAGTITLAKVEDNKDVVAVSFPENTAARLKALNGKANIAQQATRFIITNTEADGNGLVNADNVKAGYRIFVDGNAIVMEFRMEKTGRGGYTHTYKFEGAKPSAQ